MLQTPTKKETPPLRAVGYIRVSTTEQATDGFSLDAQRNKINEFCQKAQVPMHLQHIYADEGISGKNISKRPGMRQLLKDAADGKFDVVVSWKITRISRNLKDFIEIIDLLEKNDVTFRSITEPIQAETPAGRMQMALFASIAEMERGIISENVYMGESKRAADGWANCGAVIGYDSVTNADGVKTLAINDNEAAIIRYVFKLYAQKRGLRAIANELNQIGYKTKRGNPFSTIAVKDILTNPLFVGKVRYARYRNWDKKHRKGLQDDYILVEGHHPAIIDQRTWDITQRLIKKNTKMPAWNNQGMNVLTGLLRCPECGGPMAASNTTNTLADGTKKKIRYYSCANFRNKGAAVCHANSIRAEEAERLVFEKLQQVLSTKRVGDAVIHKMQINRKSVYNDLAISKRNRENEVQEICANIEKYRTIIKETLNLEPAITPQINKLSNTLLEKQGEIDDLTTEMNTFDSLPKATTIESLLQIVAEAIKGQEKKELKQLYRAFIRRIEFDKKEKLVSVHLNFDDDVLKEIKKVTNRKDDSDEGSSFLLHKAVKFVL